MCQGRKGDVDNFNPPSCSQYLKAAPELIQTFHISYMLFSIVNNRKVGGKPQNFRRKEDGWMSLLTKNKCLIDEVFSSEIFAFFPALKK